MGRLTMVAKRKDSPSRDLIYQSLLEDIVHGRISAGKKLQEAELAESFGVSRTPIREALIQLNREGFVDIQRNKGAIVSPLTLKQVEDIYDTIAQLEAGAVEKVISGNIQRKEILYLENLQSELDKISEKKEYTKYTEINQKFHSFFIKKCENDVLFEIVSDLRRKIFRLVVTGVSVPMHIDEYLLSHRKIIDAVAEKKPEAAGKLMKNHIQNSKNYLIEIIKNFPQFSF
jgi:DNA-binding GntR family transcriptional regulator